MKVHFEKSENQFGIFTFLSSACGITFQIKPQKEKLLDKDLCTASSNIVNNSKEPAGILFQTFSSLQFFIKYIIMF